MRHTQRTRHAKYKYLHYVNISQEMDKQLNGQCEGVTNESE